MFHLEESVEQFFGRECGPDSGNGINKIWLIQHPHRWGDIIGGDPGYFQALDQG
jgi:hypothetical protein